MYHLEGTFKGAETRAERPAKMTTAEQKMMKTSMETWREGWRRGELLLFK
jgi:hypothetical protein